MLLSETALDAARWWVGFACSMGFTCSTTAKAGTGCALSAPLIINAPPLACLVYPQV